jgi:hypothetical protein
MIDAVELGNEDDLYCYDADVPNGHEATQAEIATWLRGYGQFLKTGAKIVHELRYYPEAKIITSGLGHAGNYRSDQAIPRPGRLIATLQNVDGVNYLDNAEYHVDGYGTHIYPSPNAIDSIVKQTLHEDRAALGPNKPLWVTEWGFLDLKAFPNKKGETLNQGMREFLNAFDAVRREMSLGPVMYYAYIVKISRNGCRKQPHSPILLGVDDERSLWSVCILDLASPTFDVDGRL